MKNLAAKGLKPSYHLLDIESISSCKSFAEYLKTNYGGLDVLVNNAGIYSQYDAPEPLSEQAEACMRVNFWGTINVCDALLPLLRDGGRYVFISIKFSLGQYTLRVVPNIFHCTLQSYQCVFKN